MSGMVGWEGVHETGKRPCGVHPLASVGGPPESRQWMVGDPTLEPEIAPSALIHAFCTIDAGMPYGPATRVGERSFLQARVHIGHNAVVGDDCELCVGTVVCGFVTIGDGVRIAGNCWIKPRVKIGDGAIIGGGSVVTKDVPAHEVWCGNPARFLKLADTHPDLAGGHVASKQQVEDAWEEILDRARATVGYPSQAELDEWQREAARSGAFQGHDVDGDHA